MAVADDCVRGLVDGELPAARYGGHVYDARESHGMICDAVPRGARVLDVGCGTGSISKLIAEQCDAEVLGVEPDATRAELARQQGIDVVTGALTPALAAERGPFDVVVLADVLEHVTSPAALLETCKLALRLDGKLLLSTPNVAHWSVRCNLLRGRFDYATVGIMDATHLRWFTRASLRRLLIASGFDITQLRPAAGLWLDNYQRAPWGWIAGGYRERLIMALLRWWPTGMAAQWVAEARPTA